MVAALLRRPARRRVVGGPQEQGHRRRLLPGRPQPGLVDRRRLDLRLEHRLGAHRRPGRLGRRRRRRDGALRAARLVPAGAGWVFVPFYMRSMVFTMPEFLERRFSAESRYVLSIVSLITFIISKIAVGIFAGGVVFATLLPELQINIGSLHDRQLLDRLGRGHRADRALHDARRHARGRLQRRGAGGRADHRLAAPDRLRAGAARRLGASCASCAAPTCSTCGSR